MKYEYAPDLHEIAVEISLMLFPHINIESIQCFRSYGTSTKNTVARCHSLGKIMQKALETEAFYPIEFLSENFDKLSEEEKVKVIIHELMHIPKNFGGGFRHHDYVCEKNISVNYRKYKSWRNSNGLQKD